MKRILIPAVTLTLLAAAPACVNLQENLVSNISSQYYATPEGLTSAVNSAYSLLRGYWGRPESIQQQLGTDTWSYGEQNSLQYLDQYGTDLNSTRDEFRFPWNNFYQEINTVNAALDRGPGTQGIDPAIKASRLGEARFIRALTYFQLVQMYGDVSLIIHENQGIVTSATRDSAAAVYRQIIGDLDTAITMLPVSQSEVGRATRGAAQHLLSKVYLTRAYKPYGAGQADFQKALDNAKAVINSGKYSLTPVFADLWCVTRPEDPNRMGYCSTVGLNESPSENIFSIQYSSVTSQYTVNGDNALHLAYVTHYDGVAGWAGMMRDINNGRPFRRLRATPFEISLWSNRWFGTPGASDILDTRFDGSFQTVWIANTTGKNPTGTCPACTSGAAIVPGDTSMWMPGYQVSDVVRQSRKYVIDVPCPTGPTVNCGVQNYAARRVYDFEVFPQLKKFMDNTRGSVPEQDSGKDLMIERLGETYLLAAEADVALGNLTDAAQMVNVIRRRAASPLHKADNDVTPAQMTLDFIMDERERELAGEISRWLDLIRPGAQYFVDRVKLYNPVAAPNVAVKHALRPIPQSQIDGTLGGYPQNPGY